MFSKQDREKAISIEDKVASVEARVAGQKEYFNDLANRLSRLEAAVASIGHTITPETKVDCCPTCQGSGKIIREELPPFVRLLIDSLPAPTPTSNVKVKKGG